MSTECALAFAGLTVSEELDARLSAPIANYAAELAKLPQWPTEVNHYFTHGKDGKVNLYIRTYSIKAEPQSPDLPEGMKGSIAVSKCHLMEHPFVLLRGMAEVRMEDGSYELIRAPHFGITPAGRQRVIRFIEDSTWITFHVTNKTDLAEIEADLILTQPDPFSHAYPEAP
jgi:hypothetical protein